MNSELHVLLLGKAGHEGAVKAEIYLRERFNVRAVFGGWGDKLSDEILAWEGDIIVSYLAPWVVPQQLLNSAAVAAINFHPGPPEYPGIGCTNFALYNEESLFGVTCHHMTIPVDSGPIISVRRFTIAEDDTVYSLTEKCHDNIYELFVEIMTLFEEDLVFLKSKENWTRQAYRRSELDALCRLNTEMDKTEIRRRVRATSFPGSQGAYFEIDGLHFDYIGNPLKPVGVG